MSMSSALALQLFGVPQVRRGEWPLSGIRRKNCALLFVIASQQQPLSREAVCALLWPDRELVAAQPLVRTMLYELRRHLGDVLRVERDLLSLSADVVVDVRQFEAALTPAGHLHTMPTAALERALRQYQGEFLDGFGVPGAPAFDDWAAAERERLRLMALRLMAALAQRYEAEQQPELALHLAQSALRIDPLQEELQRATMRLLYRTGNRASAIRQFEGLRRLLDDELGVAPMPETRELYDQIIRDQPATLLVRPPAEQGVVPVAAPEAAPRTAAQRLPFTGRMAEWQQLELACERQQLALIEGEPGIGKTRLAEEFAARHSTLTLRAIAHALDQTLPYQPIREALRELAALPSWRALRQSLTIAPLWLYEAARIAPDLVDDPGAISAATASEAHLWESVARLLEALAERYRVVLLLDDLHWCDGATLGMLGYLARRVLSPTLAIIATARPAPQQSKLVTLLHELGRERRLAQISLEPLTPREIGTLAQAVSAETPWLSTWLGERAEGNPFFAAELLRFLEEQGWLEARQATLPDQRLRESIPETIRQMIVARTLHLSALARHVLNLAAVIGREFALDLILRASQSDELSVIDSCDELCAAALIKRGSDGEYQFDHSLTLEVVQREMSPARARAFHARIAEALSDLHRRSIDPMAGVIAQHLMASATPERAAPYALRAGQLAVSVAAWAESITFFTHVLESGVAELRVAALLGLGESHFQRGEIQLALQVVQAAIDAPEVATAEAALVETIYDLLLRTSIPTGRYADVVAYGNRLRAHGHPDLTLCAEYVIGTALNVEGADLQAAEQHLLAGEALLAQPRSFTSCITLAKLRFQRANVLGQQGKLHEAITMLVQVAAILHDDPGALDLQLTILLYNSLAHFRHLVGDPAAIGDVQTGLRIAQEKGSLTHQAYLLSTGGEIAMAQGDLDTAERCFRDGLLVAEQLQWQERIAGLQANFGRVALLRGDAALARERFAPALALAEQLGARYLATRIQIWLLPLLAPEERAAAAAQIRRVAEQGGYDTLLDELGASA